MALPENPITRKETYLAKIAGQEVQIPDVPITREEAYLNEIAKNGGGGGGYVLPTATASRLGGVKIGSGISVEEDGTISASGGGGGTSDYSALNNKPQINGVTLQGNKTTEDLNISYNDLKNKPSIPSAQIQSDWDQTDSSKVDYIKNKPALGTAAAKSVPASGDAGSGEVVMGNDSRLSDSRPASDVSSWAKQSTKPTYTASEVGAIATTQKGVASGVAELDANGKVPSSQLPSYVDDVIEGYYDTTTDRFYTESTFENVIPPESGKSWVDVASNKSYRWTGTVYSRVDEGVQLGETSGSAYRGDRGKIAYDHSQTTGNPHGTTASQVMLNDGETSVEDALNGFKFYPTGTSIVGLVSDNSPYTDANGNYVLANSTTGQSMIDDVTYKSIASTEDTRGMVGADSAAPFKKGGGDIQYIAEAHVIHDIQGSSWISSTMSYTFNASYQKVLAVLVCSVASDANYTGVVNSLTITTSSDMSINQKGSDISYTWGYNTTYNRRGAVRYALYELSNVDSGDELVITSAGSGLSAVTSIELFTE